jgi:hypothetical protein
MLGELVPAPSLGGVETCLFASVALAAATAGDRLTAAGFLATVRGRDLADVPRTGNWLSTMFGLAETAYLLGDVDTSARVYELVSPYADQPVVTCLGTQSVGSAQHILGVAALSTGDLDRAVEHFDAAIRDNLALRHWPAVIGSRARYAQALTRRGRSGDLSRAHEALDAARQESATLGVPVPEYGDGPPAEHDVATCTRTGQRWLLRYGRREALVPHSVGMPYLAVLLANPGRDVPAVDLAAGPNTPPTPTPGGQLVLDRVAVQQYRQRIGELRDRIDEFEYDNQPERAAEAATERDWLLAELAAATGLAGRTRTFTSETERARLAVGKAIRRTMATIERVDAEVAAHLHRSLHTGTRCSYRPT